MFNPKRKLQANFSKDVIFLCRLMCQANDKYQQYFRSKNTLDKVQKQKNTLVTLGYE